MIINNGEYYTELMRNGFRGGHINKRDLYFLAREWYAQGKSKQTVSDMIVEYCRKWVKVYNYAKYENLVIEIIHSLDKQKENRERNLIAFSESELLKVKELNDSNLEKVYFVLMCVAKMYGGSCVYLNSTSTLQLKEVFDWAKCNNLSKQNKLEILHKLYNLGYLTVDIKPLCRYGIRYIDNNETIISFAPNANMVYEYEKYCGVPMIYCERCGKLVKKTNNKVKYCKSCAREINIEKTRKNLK